MDYITPLVPAYPEIFLLAMVCVVLIADLFVSDDNRLATYALTQFALAGTFVVTFVTLPLEPVYTFSGMFVADRMAGVLKLLVIAGVMVMLVYSRAYIAVRGLLRGEFFVLTLFATIGMMVMISGNSLLTLYLGLELLALSLYAMVALQRDSATATEAAMKYFVLGALASGMLLYGMSMLYGATGTLEITRIAEFVVERGATDIVVVFALVFIVAGLGFKLGVAPFHMWVPDVYHGAPTAVTLFIGTAPKLAAFALIMRLLGQGLGAGDLAAEWGQMLIVMAVISLVVGNVVAIAQTNLKRMLAYSTIGHMGFLLLAILSGTLSGYAAGMFYVVVYVLMSLGAFGMILILSRSGFEAETLEDFRGLNERSPWYAFMMLLLMFSMAGVPPTVGFYAKLAVLQAVLAAGHVWLAVLAVLCALIGAFYYLRLVKLIYFDAPVDTAPIRPHGDVHVLMSANGLAVVVFGILPQPLMALCVGAIELSLG
jgi:NADH-quinone oxidoreductase subunit N